MSSLQKVDDNNNKLQIVAFSTDETTQTPNDIINMFLTQQNHEILKKSRHSLAFSTTLKDQSQKITILIRSILNLEREYTGINDVNCYIIFINLEQKESLDKLDSIIKYLNDFCELMKKIFVLGMISGKEEKERSVNKNDLIKKLDNSKLNYEYKEINLIKSKEICDAILQILDYSSKHEINGDYLEEKDGGQAKSCEIF